MENIVRVDHGDLWSTGLLLLGWQETRMDLERKSEEQVEWIHR